MTILYALIARGATVLCSHQAVAGNFEDVANSMLVNIPTRKDAKTTYTSHNYLFHVLVENGLIYLASSETDFGRLQPYSFLNEIKRQLQQNGLTSQAQFAACDEFDKSFKSVLIAEMERYSQVGGRGGGDQISVLQSQVDEVKGVMTQNIDKVLERGENLDALMDKTTDLEAHSATFHKTARKVQRRMWWQNMKMKLIIAAIVIVVLLVLILIILFSTGVLPVKSSPAGGTTTTPGGVTMTTAPP